MEPGRAAPTALEWWDRLAVEVAVLTEMLEDADPADRAAVAALQARFAALAERHARLARCVAPVGHVECRPRIAGAAPSAGRRIPR